MVSSLSEAKFSGSGRSGWPRGGHGVIPAPTVPDTVPHMKSGAVESRRRQRREVRAGHAGKAKLRSRGNRRRRLGDCPRGARPAECGSPRVLRKRKENPNLFFSGFWVGSRVCWATSGPRPAAWPAASGEGTQLSLHLHCVGSRGGMGVQRCGVRIPRVEPHVTGLMRKSSSERGSP